MLLRIRHQALHFPRQRAILPFANNPRFISLRREITSSSLVAMGDADPEGVIIEPGNLSISATFIFLLEE
jgi:hypothetical protein